MEINILVSNLRVPEYKVPFKYKGVDLKSINTPSDNIDIISFDSISLPVDDDGIDYFINTVKNHKFYEFAVKNPNIPKIFFYLHEYIHLEIYKKFINILCETLNTVESKIIIYDTQLYHSPNKMFHPLQNRFKAFDFFDWCVNPDLMFLPRTRTKKFACLMNKVNDIRFYVFDKMLKSYEDDFISLRNENTVSFRNVVPVEQFLDKFNNDLNCKKFLPTVISKDFSKLTGDQLCDLRNDSSKMEYYWKKVENEFELPILPQENNNIFLPYPYILDDTYFDSSIHNEDFFKKIEIPWVLDYENIHDDGLKFFKTLDIYSTSYFSIVADSYSGDSIEDASFTEKLLNPIIMGNLPFLVNVSYYYDFFEEVGFDFSYLKTIFDIDYKNLNKLPDAYEALDKFVSYFRNNSFETVKKAYEECKYIADSNQKIMKQIWVDKVPTDAEWDFLNRIKKEKFL